MIRSDYSKETNDKQVSGKSRAFYRRECKKLFSQRSNLTRHVLNHKGKKSHTCQHCLCKFSQRCNLVRHLRTHTGEKPFGCVHCSKRFSQRSHLSVHVRIHTGERPFECKMCPKKFAQRWLLARHKRSHSASSQITQKCFKCASCLKKFSKKWNLSKRLRAVHSQSVPSHIVSEDPKLKTTSTQWSKLLIELRKIVVKGPTWPKSSSVSWETYPKLIRFLLEKKLNPGQFVSSGTHWDPCYYNGKVADVYRETGLRIRHKVENFWMVWEEVLTPKTFIITNPPYGLDATYWIIIFWPSL